MITLKEGDIAPNFSGKTESGKPISLEDYIGKKVILYFYPADDTPGCTKESCNLRDNYKSLQVDGFEVIGVSPDDEDSHVKFIQKYDLPFTLIADTDKSIMTSYGTWGEKNMYGKIVIGVLRTTFVINEEGRIMLVIKRPDTSNHTEQIRKKLSI